MLCYEGIESEYLGRTDVGVLREVIFMWFIWTGLYGLVGRGGIDSAGVMKRQRKRKRKRKRR